MKSPRLWLFSVAALAATLLLSAPARAAMIVNVGSVAVNPGTDDDFLDVTLTNTGPAAVTVGGFSFGLSVTNSNIVFTSVNISTALPYIFSGSSLFGPTISTIPPPAGQTVVASDLHSLSGAGIAAGVTVGLGRVVFNVALGAAPGNYVVTLAPAPETTSLSDATGANIPIDTLNNGQITINEATGVPEPSTVSLVLLALPGLAWPRRRLRSSRHVDS